MDKYGSPELNDPTAEWEKMMASSTAKAKSFQPEKVINRPPGTIPVKPEDQRLDWMRGQHDPQYWQTMVQGFLDQGNSPDLAAWKALTFHKTMMEKNNA